MIGINSLVECVYDFIRERVLFKYNYPYLGKILTVNKIQFDEHENQMLWFDELKILIPLTAICFEEIQDEAEGDFILNEVFKIANKI